MTLDVTLDTDSSVVASSATRVITGGGVLQSGNCAVVSTAERIFESSVVIETTDTIVTGTAERTITAVGTIQSDDSNVVAVVDVFQQNAFIPLAKVITYRQKNTRLINVSAKKLYNITVKQKPTRLINARVSEVDR